MLKHISSIWEYRDFLKSEEINLDPAQRKRLSSKLFRSALHKLKKLDPALASDLLFSLYSNTGRPAIDPSILIRSFILMQHLGYTSVDRWCNDLHFDSLLQYLIGTFDPPSMASHYDFIIRLTGIDPHMDELYPKDHYKKEPMQKPKRGEKLKNYTHTDTYDLLDKYKNGAECDRERMMYILQSLFNELAVIPSLDTGFIDKDHLILNGDGSSLHIHASRYGHQVLDGNEEDSVFRFSAPDADIGWDSDLNSFYLGFTFYNISCHNPSRNIDLPVFISLEKASRHDALTSISAAAQLFDMNPDLHPLYMCLDSASDSLPIYQYFRLNHIIPVIDHNPRRDSSKTDPQKNRLSGNGFPICDAGHEMINYGYDPGRCRRKFRCPLAMGKIDHCDHKEECSSSDYGRVVYINDGDDARNGGPLLYKSDLWKQIYKNRTSTERVNNRVLNDCNLHQMRVRNGAKNAFFCIFAGINIHLDAWIKDEV